MNLKWNWKKKDSYKQVWDIDLPDSGYIVNKDHRKPEENRNFFFELMLNAQTMSKKPKGNDIQDKFKWLL